ncbi:ribbon-helix-helix domain-containing protein [Candidatus Woesearchaeota archaeon]|nr:ribbon-helix-helix domain-containing protein [Candidatus Woesearchaeota archaeon]
MVTELVTFKLDNKFLKEVDSISRKSGFSSRTDFIRNALREKVDEIKLKKAMMEIAHLKGASKKKISDKDYERARDLAFEKISKELR